MEDIPGSQLYEISASYVLVKESKFNKNHSNSIMSEMLLRNEMKKVEKKKFKQRSGEHLVFLGVYFSIFLMH